MVHEQSVRSGVVTRPWPRQAVLCAALVVAPSSLALAQADAGVAPHAVTTASDVDRAGMEDAGAGRAHSPKVEVPPVERDVLIAQGEPVADIETILGTLDRRAPVRAVAFSPDASLIASGSEDHLVRLWHRSTGRLLRRLQGHSSAVTAVGFSPDGLVLASASNDRTVRLWDARSGRLVRTLQGHVYHVYALAFDPQSRSLATASWDRTIQLWDVRSGALLKKMRGHSAAVRAIDVSPDGKLLASGSDDQSVRLWDVDAGKERQVLAGHTASVGAVRFRADGQELVSGSTDGSARVWRLADGKMLRKLADCGGPVLGLAGAPNGQILAGACGVGGAVLWDAPTGAQLRPSEGSKAETRAIAFSQDGAMLARGSEDASIVVEDVATGRTLVSLSANVAHLEAVTFSPDGQSLAALSRDHRVLLWREADAHKVLSQVLLGPKCALRALAYSPDGRVIAAAGDEGDMVLWDQEGAPSFKRTKHEASINALAFTPDGRLLASAGNDSTVRLWDLERDAETLALKGHRAPVRALASSPDGKLLASASDDQTVRLWEIATGQSLGVMRSHRAPVTSLGFSPDGKWLVTGSQDRTIDVWQHTKGKLLKPLRKELASGVVALALQGNFVVSASSDGLLTLWELAGNRPLHQVSAHADVSALAFSPDGLTLASASRDGILRLWDAKTLAQRSALAGSTRQRWFACNQQTCWRNDDGTLLGRIDEQGDFAPVPPSGSAQRTTLKLGFAGGSRRLVEGKTIAIPLEIENRGAHPAYWVNVAQAPRPSSSKGSLLLIPPPTIAVLDPGARAKVVCEVSALGAYENPVPHDESLRLSITSASAEPLSLAIPIHIETPHLTLRGLASPATGDLVMASLAEVAMAQLQPVILQGRLRLDDQEQADIAPITLDQALNGQDLTLAFPLPEGVRLAGKTRATLTLRKSTHPAHQWTFAHAPVRMPTPGWFWAILVAGSLALILVFRRTGLRAWTRVLGRAGKRLIRWGGALLVGLAKLLLALFTPRATLRALADRVQRGIVAMVFFRLQPETQCSHLARQLAARWQPFAGGREPIFTLHFGPELPLNLERCLLVLASTGLAHLEALEDEQDTVTVVLSESPRSALMETLPSPRHLVVLSKAAMKRVLRSPRPALIFAQVVCGQLGRAFSLYRSALSLGQRRPFHGRKAELRRLAVEPRGNHLIIGPQGIGKTRLLDEVHRRLLTRPSIECHYLSLDDDDLGRALADALAMPGQPPLATLLQRLAQPPQGKRAVLLVDDADTWVTRDAAQGGPELQALARLGQDKGCSIVLAGFLGLLHATWPAPGRKPFGHVIRLEALDDEACAALASEPMAALDAHYARADLVDLVTRQSAGMPGLVLALCDQIVEGLQPTQRLIDRALVDRACQSEAVTRAITAWRPHFGFQDPELATLDQAVMLSAVFKARFTLAELQATLTNLGVGASAIEIEHSTRRLVAACVFEPWLGHFQFRVPLFQQVMQKAALTRVIAT